MLALAIEPQTDSRGSEKLSGRFPRIDRSETNLPINGKDESPMTTSSSAKTLPMQLCRHDDGTIFNGFIVWQTAYADYKIYTFPVEVGETKVPMVLGWPKVGPYLSAKHAQKFPYAPALGINLGPKKWHTNWRGERLPPASGITELDIDSRDERVLADALNRHGTTPIIIKTASGKYKAWYSHNNEKRATGSHRPWPDLPIDLLGGGFTVGPPSFNADYRQYQFIAGNLDDIGNLPVMQNLNSALYKNAPRERANEANGQASPLAGMVEHDGRNQALFDAIGPIAREIYARGGNRNQVFEVAMNINQACAEPMAPEEVNTVVGNVWQYTVDGENRIGLRSAIMPVDDIDALIGGGQRDQDALMLLSFLRGHQGPSAEFWITNSLHDEKFGWRRQRLVAARDRLIELGYVRQTRPARSRSPALYRWRGYMGVQN